MDSACKGFCPKKPLQTRLVAENGDSRKIKQKPSSFLINEPSRCDDKPPSVNEPCLQAFRSSPAA